MDPVDQFGRMLAYVDRLDGLDIAETELRCGCPVRLELWRARIGGSAGKTSVDA
jgi:hypothetical protein